MKFVVKLLMILAYLMLFSGLLLAQAEQKPANSAAAPLAVSWKTLQKVEVVKSDNLYLPKFDPAVKALMGQWIELRGYMMPVDHSLKQETFIFSAIPMKSCYFCLPGGPESFVEVRVADPIRFTNNPIVIVGQLQMMKNDPMGMYYRLVGARVKT